MALLRLTDAQRAAALEKAAAARRARAELKDRLKRGSAGLKQVFNDAESDEMLAQDEGLGAAAGSAQGEQGRGAGDHDRSGDSSQSPAAWPG